MEHKFVLAKGALKHKKRQQEIDMAKLRSTASKADLKARTLDLKEAKAKHEKDKTQKEVDEALRIQTLAAAACTRITKWHDDFPEKALKLRAKIQIFVKDGARNLKGLSKEICPTRFTFDKACMVNVAKTYAAQKDIVPVWCTTSFRAWLFAGKSQAMLTEPDPIHHFTKLVGSMLPSYTEMFGYEYQLGNLLRNNKMCLDLAFLEAVWRYSRKVTTNTF